MVMRTVKVRTWRVALPVVLGVAVGSFVTSDADASTTTNGCTTWQECGSAGLCHDVDEYVGGCENPGVGICFTPCP